MRRPRAPGDTLLRTANGDNRYIGDPRAELSARGVCVCVCVINAGREEIALVLHASNVWSALVLRYLTQLQ